MSRRIHRQSAREAIYGADFAPVYDQLFASLNTSQALDTLLPLARQRGGRVLELAAGTGRLAIGLAMAGCEVVGLDISQEMLAVLQAKYSGRNLRVVRGDMAHPERLGLGQFGLILLAFNGIFHLLTNQRQRSCIQGAAQLLRPGGLLVIETSAPGGVMPARRCDVRLNVRGTSTVSMVLRLRDAEAARVRGWHAEITRRSLRVLRYRQRYLPLGSLDRFAAEARLVLRHRWSDWACRPWDDTAAWAITIYQTR